MGLRALGRVAFLATLPVLLVGCDLLAAALYPELDPFAPDPFAQPGAPTAYEGGTATIEIRQGDQLQTVVLDELVSGSEFWEFGAMATWRNSDGWALTVNAYSAHPMDPFGSAGDITLQRVTGTELWTTDYTTTYERCLVQVGELSDERLRGSVDCDGLRWVDGLGSTPVFGTPTYVEGQGVFHVHATFEATPDNASRS